MTQEEFDNLTDHEKYLYFEGHEIEVDKYLEIHPDPETDEFKGHHCYIAYCRDIQVSTGFDTEDGAFRDAMQNIKSLKVLQ